MSSDYIVLSENEVLRQHKLKNDELRKQRLLQVRQQAKQIAALRRLKHKEMERKKKQALIQRLKKAWISQRDQELNSLKSELMKVENTIGFSHHVADQVQNIQLSDAKEKYWNFKMCVERGNIRHVQAIEDLKNEKIERERPFKELQNKRDLLKAVEAQRSMRAVKAQKARQEWLKKNPDSLRAPLKRLSVKLVKRKTKDYSNTFFHSCGSKEPPAVNIFNSRLQPTIIKHSEIAKEISSQRNWEIQEKQILEKQRATEAKERGKKALKLVLQQREKENMEKDMKLLEHADREQKVKNIQQHLKEKYWKWKAKERVQQLHQAFEKNFIEQDVYE